MPVPKDKQALYGKIVGHMMNKGKSLDEAKDIADRAIKHHDGDKRGNGEGKKHSVKNVKKKKG